jgi:hypothetical protein
MAKKEKNEDKTPKFTAEMLMIAMVKHSKIKDWATYADAISNEAITQGCDRIPEETLPRRIGQVVKKAAPYKPPAYPTRPRSAPAPKKKIADIAKELGWKQ